MSSSVPPERRVENQAIREWGMAHDWPGLAARGKIPGELREAYRNAHEAAPAAGQDQAAADDDDLDADSGDDDFADIDDPPEDSAASRPPPRDDAAATPPPASLDEARERVRDTRSAHLGRAGRRAPSARKARGSAEPAPKITPKVVGDIEGKMAFWMSLTAEPWMIADPICGGAYADSVPDLAKAAAPLICQSPDLVRMLTKSSQFILWTNLLMAGKPIVLAIVAHHIMHTVEIDRGPAQPAGQQAAVGPQTDFSAYAGRPAA